MESLELPCVPLKHTSRGRERRRRMAAIFLACASGPRPDNSACGVLWREVECEGKLILWPSAILWRLVLHQQGRFVVVERSLEIGGR